MSMMCERAFSASWLSSSGRTSISTVASRPFAGEAKATTTVRWSSRPFWIVGRASRLGSIVGGGDGGRDGGSR